MLSLRFLALFAWLVYLPAMAAVPMQQAEVVQRYPHDVAAFTQGLVIAAGALYEGTGRNGESALRKVELASGKVLQQVKIPPQHFGEGITILNGKVYQLTWQSHVGFVYDLATFRQLQSFYLAGEGWGITHDDKQLIVSDGTANLRFFDPTTMKETGRVMVTEDGMPLERLNELEFINGEVWANVWYADYIVRIDPVTGVVKGKINLAGLHQQRSADDVLNGIAWDASSKRLFITGKLWDTLYEIRVKE